MTEIDAWNAFWQTGRIYDYLMYKCIHNDDVEDIENNEIYNQRTDYKGTEHPGEG